MKWWVIAKNDLRLNIRDKMFLFWLLVFPLLFAFIFGMAFRGASKEDPKVSLAILNRDGGILSQALVDELRHEKFSINMLNETGSENNRILIIPESFTADIIDGKQVELVLRQREGRSLEAGQTAYAHILKAIIKILSRTIKTAPTDAEDLKLRFSETHLERLISLRTEAGGRAEAAPSGFTHSLPGSIVMFLLFTVLMYGGIGLLQERRLGILERLSIHPVSFFDIITGKWVGRTILGLMQITVLLAAGRFLFKVNLGTSLPGLFIISLVFSASIAGLSLFLGSILHKEEILIIFNILLANLMAALGGCWWPLEIVPKSLRTMGFLLPTGWTMDAFHKLIFFGAGFSSVLTHIAVLSGFTLFFLILAVKFFKIRRHT